MRGSSRQALKYDDCSAADSQTRLTGKEDATVLIPKTEIGNVGLVCKDCAEQHKKEANAMAHEPEYFVGKYCKLAFPITGPTTAGMPKKPRSERMWVRVIGLAETEGEELCGALANDPIYATQFAFNDVIEFSRSEIQAVQVGL